MESALATSKRAFSTQTVSKDELKPVTTLKEHVPIHSSIHSELAAKQFFRNLNISTHPNRKIHAISTDYPEPNTDNPTSVFGYPQVKHGLAEAILQAYGSHQHLRLTPDDIWLTIAQGVSSHINNNAERFRHYFVKHQGQEDIVVLVYDILSLNIEAKFEGNWPEAINRLAQATADRVQKVDLKEILESDFSTSTSASIAISRIILLDAMKNYFRYGMRGGCGIPKVTLEGTLKDWEHLQEKVHRLRKLGLDMDFWLDRLEPVIWQFVATYRGEIDYDFWSKPILRQGNGSGTPMVWTGWVSAFFPYDKRGNKLENNCIYVDEIPEGRVNVPFETDIAGSLEFSAGYLGARQDLIANNEIVVSPVIGWFVVDQDPNL